MVVGKDCASVVGVAQLEPVQRLGPEDQHPEEGPSFGVCDRCLACQRLADVADGPDPADDKLERLILALAKANRDLLTEEPHLFAALSLAVAKRHAISRRNRTRVRALFERVVDEGMATGVFEPRDRDRAIAFVIDATNRFIHPASLALEADVPQASVDTRLSTLIRVILRVLGSGIV